MHKVVKISTNSSGDSSVEVGLMNRKVGEGRRSTDLVSFRFVRDARGKGLTSAASAASLMV